jgi:hypothetical protein
LLVVYDGRILAEIPTYKQRQQRRMSALAKLLYDGGKPYHPAAAAAQKLG